MVGHSLPLMLLLVAIASLEAVQGKVIEVDSENYETVLYDRTKHVVWKVYVPWCEPCQEFQPIWDELEQYYSARKDIVFAQTNAEESQFLCRGHRVTTYPSVLLFTKEEKFDENGPIFLTKFRQIEDVIHFIDVNI